MSTDERRPTKAPSESPAKATTPSLEPRTDNRHCVDELAVSQWLTVCFPDSQGFLVVSHKDRDGHFVSTSRAFTDRNELLAHVLELERAGAESIYLRTTTTKTAPEPGRRGAASDSFELPGFFADIDYGTLGHAHDPSRHEGLPLPPNAEQAALLVSEAGLPEPSVWVDSGGGLYAWWLFDAAVDLTDPIERARHARGLADIQLALQAAAARLGYYYDTGVKDLARVLRLPGTVNRKAGTERACRITDSSGEFYRSDALLGRIAAAIPCEGDGPGTRETREASGTNREGTGVFERFSGGVSFEALLTDAGWRPHEPAHADEVLHCFTRPGDDVASPCSARVLRDAPGVLVVWSTNTGLPAGAGQKLTVARAFSCLWHGGDEAAGAKDLAKAYVGQPCSPAAQRLVAKSTANTGAKSTGLSSGTPTRALDPDRYVDRRDGLQVATLARDVERLSGPFALGPGDTLWVYRDGVYVPNGGTEVGTAVVELLGEHFRESHQRNALAVLKAQHTRVRLPEGTDLPSDQYLNVANGLLDWRTGVLQPHSPDVPSIHRIPVLWDPDASCPHIDRFLPEVFGDDPSTQSFIDEVVGAVLYGGRPFHQRAIMLYGRGKNGKGVFLDLVRALVGSANISEVKPQQLDGNRFAAAQLYGKLANLAGDVASTAFQSAERFKEVTAGDVIEAERKYGQPFSFTPVATIVASFNEMPTTADRSEGFFRRWIVVPFPHRFVDKLTGAEDERLRQPNAAHQITTDHELAGYLNRAVAGLQRLHQRGDFQPPEAVSAATRDYRELGDPIVAMLKAKFQPASGAFLARRKIWDEYKAFTEDNGTQLMAAARFYEHLPNAADAAWSINVQKHKRNGTQGFLGLSIGPDNEA